MRAQKGLDVAEIEDVIIGCATPEAEQGMNVARIAALRAGLPVTVSAMTINRFCSSGLQAIALAAQRILAGQGDIAIAGGAESMSMVPMGGHKISPNPWLIDHYPDTYLNMGLTAENLAKEVRVHAGAGGPILAGKSSEGARRARSWQVQGRDCSHGSGYTFVENGANGSSGASAAKTKSQKVTFETDEGPRADTSMEALGKLKPVFHAHGVVTAGNSSQMSDGAAAAVLMSAERARGLGLKPLARFVAFATAGCPPEEMGVGPVYAIPKALKIAGLRLDQIEVIELNEAFAAQALTVIKLAGLDPARVNVNGGAVALGHPLGCTGAKLTATILREMERRRQARYGLVTMCIGGGMGAAGILERAA